MKKIMLVGQFPPPIHGLSMANSMIINSSLKDKYDFSIVNIAKSMNEKNKAAAILSDIGHIIKFACKFIYFQPDCVYITIAQTKLGFLRDTFFIGFSSLFNKNVVLHLHGAFFRKLYDKEGSFFQGLVKKYCNKCSRIIVLSEKFRGIFEGIVDSSKIGVVSNGVDLNYISTDDYLDAISNKKTKKELNVLYLSNLIMTKGYFDFIKSIKGIPDDLKINFLLAGAWTDDHEKREVLKYIEENQIGHRIKFLGVVNGKIKKNLLLSSDIFVLPTYYHNEGQPISIIEAMSAGLAVISSDNGCITDMVKDDFNGAIVEKENPEAISKIIIKLYNDKDKLAKLSENSRKLFEKSYTSNVFIDNLDEIFDANS